MAAKTYEVVGSHAVDGNAPGARFTAELDSWREAALIEGGHLAVVKASKEPENAE